ncbi:maleylacetoacetate isomerase [Paraburkholderia youngii]|uniref:maleylacetoacetate isomerase n=1 Tax=Paraburkholderia youngii TaxID=2782701 RepID=UPI003D211359
MKLYSYFRSSASFRVRIALAIKQIPFEYLPVHLVRGGGQQHSEMYRALNNDGLVPTLVHGQEVVNQSLAIIEYLNDLYPEKPLLPGNAEDRAFVRSIALQIACDVHPLNNLRVLKYLETEFSTSGEARHRWYRHWIDRGFRSLEKKLANDSRVGKFAFGDQPTLADICIVPQVWNARRFSIPLEDYPIITRIESNAMRLDAFRSAEPSNQVDAE